MNSKEALKRLKQETCPATYMADFDKNECIEVIKQDLERLEVLEKENQTNKDVIKLQNEVLKIKEEENAKLKEVIEFLKDRIEIVISYYGKNYFVETPSQCSLINKEQYDLLKEVLEDDK